MPLPPGIPTKILKPFYQKFVKQSLKTKKDYQEHFSYLLSTEFAEQVERFVEALTYKPKRYDNVDFSSLSKKDLKQFFDEHLKLTGKEQKQDKLRQVINFVLDGMDEAVGKELGVQLGRKPKPITPTEPVKSLPPPPQELIDQAQLNVKLDSRGVPAGANEIVEGLTNFYLSQRLGNKASFLVQKNVESLSFEDIELVLNVDEAEFDIFASDRNQETIFNFIKQAKKDVVVVFLGIVFWKDFDAGDARSSHSNLLIYRKSKQSLERFEPDSTPIELDESIDKAVRQVFDLNDVPVKKYISPLNSCVRIQGLEEMENQKNLLMRNLPVESKESVSCFFWNVLYLQNRLDNLDASQEELINELVDSIQTKVGSLGLFIKDYSRTLIRYLNQFRRMNPNNVFQGQMRRNIYFGGMNRMNVDSEQKFDRAELKKKPLRELSSIAFDLGITADELKGKTKNQKITMILDRQAGFIRPDEELDLEVDDSTIPLTKIINDLLEGKINPKKDGAKLQKQFDKLDKKEGDKTFNQKIARIQQRIDIAFVTAIGLGDIEINGKKLGNPKDYGQPPFTKTEKTVISIVKKLNPLGLLSETDFLKKALNFLKAFFGKAPRAAAGAAQEPEEQPREGVEDDFLRGDFRPGFKPLPAIDVPFLRNPFRRGGVEDSMIVEKLLSGNLLKTFKEQTEEVKEEIIEDAKNLIKQSTDFTFETASDGIKRRFLIDAIGFVVFGE